MTTKIRYILLLAIASMVIIACSKDKLDGNALVCEEAIIYNDVRTVISESCGYVGCHNGIDRGENYNNFAGLENFLLNGQFTSRALILRDMPFENDNGPATLNIEQIELLQCWEQNGFSEF